MSARDDVLDRIRRALATAPPGADPVPRDYRVAGTHPLAGTALLDLFSERVEDYRARVHRTPAGEAPAAVAAALAAGLADRAGHAPARARPRVVVPPGLDLAWLASTGAEVVVDGGPEGALATESLDGCDAVVTAARAAVAETGTIVLDGTGDQGRRAISLVPDLHVCVVRAEQVVAGVPDVLPLLDPTRPLTWISGPSATSDIELDRVEGVHGPRTLEVVLLDAPAGADTGR